MSEAEWVEKKLQQWFAPEEWPQARALLQQYGAQDWEREPDRVRLALLKLSAGKLEELRVWLQTAQQDYRDVLVGAEYRQQSQFDAWNLDDAGKRALKQARKRDLQQLLDWLEHEPDKGETND